MSFHGHRAATPLGPAAGPQTQLAQNVALSYLSGGRILELKTVQVNDHLVIPRPCIDMRTVGFNIEWSQELLVEDSLREYAKARLLVAILDELCGIPPAERDVVFDLSVGYDLQGIRSRKMAAFFEGVRDASSDPRRGARGAQPRASAVAPAFRRRPVPGASLGLGHALDVPRLSGGRDRRASAAPPRERGPPHDREAQPDAPRLRGDVEEILHGRLGYGAHRACAAPAFDKDLQWEDALSIARDLSAEAARRGLGFGFKVTNTLVVENAGDFMPGDEAYLSGEPLHVLALGLGLKLREELGPAFPLSFSAGVDAANVAGVVACGFVPVTSCTDLLRPGGYQRLHRQAEALAAAMGDAEAATVPDFIRARGGDRGRRSRRTPRSSNHRARGGRRALGDERYAAATHGKAAPEDRVAT